MTTMTRIETPCTGAYRLDVLDGHTVGPATVNLCMSREQALGLAYRINRFLAEMDDKIVVLPVGGNLLFD